MTNTQSDRRAKLASFNAKVIRWIARDVGFKNWATDSAFILREKILADWDAKTEYEINRRLERAFKN